MESHLEEALETAWREDQKIHRIKLEAVALFIGHTELAFIAQHLSAYGIEMEWHSDNRFPFMGNNIGASVAMFLPC